MVKQITKGKTMKSKTVSKKIDSSSNHNYFMSDETVKKLSTNLFKISKIVNNEIIVEPINQ